MIFVIHKFYVTFILTDIFVFVTNILFIIITNITIITVITRPGYLRRAIACLGTLLNENRRVVDHMPNKIKFLREIV